jgi:hypothetical protein
MHILTTPRIASTLQAGTSGQLYTPDPRLSSDSATPMSLVFLANRAFYQNAVNDPWFNATSPIGSVANGDTQTSYFQNNSPGSVMGCVEELQIW